MEIPCRWHGEVRPSPPEKGGGCRGCGVKKGMFLIIRFLRHFFIPVDKSEKEELNKCRKKSRHHGRRKLLKQ